MAQHVALRHPGLVRRPAVAAGGPGGPVPGAPPVNDKVRRIMAEPGGGDGEDQLYLFFPQTGRAAAGAGEVKGP